MDQLEREYDYKPRWYGIIVFGGLGLAGVLLFGGLALFSNRDAMINGRLVPAADAKNLNWLFCGVSFIGCAAAAGQWHQRSRCPRKLVLGRSALIVPASFWHAATREIPYHEITRIRDAVAGNLRCLTVYGPGFKFIIDAMMLPSAAAFEEVRQLLANRIAASRNPVLQSPVILPDVLKQHDAQFAKSMLMFAWLVLAATALILAGSILATLHERKFSPVGFILTGIVFAGGMGLRIIAKRELRRQATESSRKPSPPPMPEPSVEPPPATHRSSFESAWDRQCSKS